MALVFTAIRFLLGSFFAFTGALKLTEQISAEVFQQMVSEAWARCLRACVRRAGGVRQAEHSVVAGRYTHGVAPV